MSKNGWRLFRDFDPYVTSPFGYRINPISNVKTFHTGTDYGTNGKKLPTYGLEGGTVVGIGSNNINGNYVYVNYPRLGKNAIYQHLDSIKVKKGDLVTKDTVIGIVGATGEVTGIHLHFGFYPEADQSKGWYDRRWEDFESYEFQEELKILGTPEAREEEKDQIEVIISNLYLRDNPNGNILGYIKEGIYNILDTKTLDGYTWYKIGENNWIAYTPDYGKLYLKKEETTEPTVDTKEQEIPDVKGDKEEEITNPNKESTFDEEKQEGTSKFTLFFQRFLDFIKKILKKLGIL